MNTSEKNILSVIRKINFSKESKKSANIVSESVSCLHKTIGKQMSEIQKDSSVFLATKTMVSVLNERIFEILEMKSKHKTYSKNDKTKEYFNNIVDLIREEISVLYNNVENN